MTGLLRGAVLAGLLAVLGAGTWSGTAHAQAEEHPGGDAVTTAPAANAEPQGEHAPDVDAGAAAEEDTTRPRAEQEQPPQSSEMDAPVTASPPVVQRFQRPKAQASPVDLPEAPRAPDELQRARRRWPSLLGAWALAHAGTSAMAMGLTGVLTNTLAVPIVCVASGYAWPLAVPVALPFIIAGAVLGGVVMGTAWMGLPSAVFTVVTLRDALGDPEAIFILGLAGVRAAVSSAAMAATAASMALAVTAVVLLVLYQMNVVQPGPQYSAYVGSWVALLPTLLGCAAFQGVACAAQVVLAPAEFILLARGAVRVRKEDEVSGSPALDDRAFDDPGRDAPPPLD